MSSSYWNTEAQCDEGEGCLKNFVKNKFNKFKKINLCRKTENISIPVWRINFKDVRNYTF